VELGQSPFLNILSEDKVRQTLREMTRSPDERLTRDLAREVCQRAGSKAYLTGSIATLGAQYVIGIEAQNCASGDALAQEQVTAAGKEQVIPALGQAASKLRKEVGESLSCAEVRCSAERSHHQFSGRSNLVLLCHKIAQPQQFVEQDSISG